MVIRAVVGSAIILALGALCGCSSSPVRTEPDQVETAALSSAQLAAQFDRVAIDDDAWTQLWTPTQAGTRIAACVKRGTEGLVEFQPKPLALNSSALAYSISFVADAKASSADGGVGPPYFDSGTVQRLVDGCIASYPVDFRLSSVPARERGALYAYDSTVLRRCLMSHGQRVPQLPSRARFEGLLRASAPWNAYDLVVVPSRSAWYALADACPALPADIAGDVAALGNTATSP